MSWWVFLLIGVGIVVAILIGIFLSMIPELKRYLRMEKM